MQSARKARQHGINALVFGVTGLIVYAVMIFGTLAHLEAVSGDLPFDMRPLGYTYSEANQFLAGLGLEGRAYYLTRQIPLDLFYPALLALTLVSTLRWLEQRLSYRRWVRLGVVTAIGAAACDYAENLGVIAMILTWPELSSYLVGSASIATTVKSALTTLAAAFVLVLGVMTIRRPAPS
ncbi:hypothetical protein C7964_101937 [Loktanella sp. PT4BL]|jgi:hypothetical protein|uniref:hypothetical protein n=1 Tax=Loktanella sp. PT4BL TaxID=2135611 RepID=UPI000D752A1A|nr:hypothetical protein [Loktanella sp. PT4BL]PXW72820.1 hypothetical protein C7964_101937 [Loktanella sp. PT4BL]